MAGMALDRDVVLELARRLERSEDVVLATAIRTNGSPPCQPGQKLLLGPSSPLAGTLGCSELDAQAVADAPDVLDRGRAVLRTYDHALGQVEAYLEPYPGRPLLVVLSATPVAGYLLRWAPDLGWETALVESRPERVTPELAALAGAVVSSPAQLDLATGGGAPVGFGSGASVEPGDPPPVGSGGRAPVDVVHTDHDAPEVAAHLADLLAAGARFVGVMGSARHTGAHLEAIRARGLAEADVARVQSPVGLDLGARSPAEIALSILAGLVAYRSGRQGGWLDRRT